MAMSRSRVRGWGEGEMSVSYSDMVVGRKDETVG